MCSAVFQWAYCVLANANIVFVCVCCVQIPFILPWIPIAIADRLVSPCL